MKPGTILKSKDMIVCESKLEECQRQNRESLARMRKLEEVSEKVIKTICHHCVGGIICDKCRFYPLKRDLLAELEVPQ